MSRMLRQKAPRRATAPKKKARKPSNATTESSDDDYAGVNDFSDDEEDEPDVMAAEERAIINTVSKEGEDIDADDSDDGLDSRPLAEDDVWEGFPDDFQLPVNDFFEEHIARGAFDNIPESLSPHHVTFDLHSDTSESELGDVNDNMFPDIFVDQDSLDPTFRRRVEADDAEDAGSDGYWGLSDDDTFFAELTATKPMSEDDEDSDDSSLDSDDNGDTTDEDLPPAARKIIPMSRFDEDDSNSSSEEEMTIARRTPAKAQTPKLARWVHRNNSPFALVGNDGNSLIVFRGRRTETLTFDSSPLAHDLAGAQSSSAPILGNPGNLMMSALYPNMATNDYFGDVAADAIGPPEAFYPFMTVNPDGTVSQDTSSVGDENLDDEEEHNLLDFEDQMLDFGGDEFLDTDADDEYAAEDHTTPGQASTPARPSTAKSDTEVHPLLTHFNKTKVNVGAFRQNQNRHHQLTSNLVSQESLAFHNPQSPAPIRGVRSGRLEFTNTPMTPVRKQKSRKRTMPSSPPSASASALKRKSGDFGDGGGGGHKRNRSVY